MFNELENQLHKIRKKKVFAFHSDNDPEQRT